MNRRRLCWLCAALLLIGSIATALYLFSARDSDFYVIGKKPRAVRANLAMLETTVDAADFRDCNTVQDVLNRLHAKLDKGEQGRTLQAHEDGPLIWINRHAIHVDDEAFVRNWWKEITGHVEEDPVQIRLLNL